MNSSPIVVTGIGFFTPLGDSIPTLAAAFRENRTALHPLTRQDWSTMPTRHGGEINLEQLIPYDLDPIKLKGFKHYVHFGLAATRNALTMAGLLPGQRTVADNRLGAFVCSGINGENVEGLFEGLSLSADEHGEFDPRRYASQGIDTVHPKWILTAISNNLIFFLTQEFKLCGDNNNSTYSTLGGVQMLDAACRSLRSGACDAAIVTGSDSLLNWQVADDLSKAGLLATDPTVSSMNCHGQSPRGALPSEGSACLVLERKDLAVSRGAQCLAEIIDIQEATDCKDPADPMAPGEAMAATVNGLFSRLPGQARNLNLCLDGSAVPEWDPVDREAIRSATEDLRKEGRSVNILAVRPWFGHTFSAAFLLDCAVNVAALSHDLAVGMPHPATEDRDLFQPPVPAPDSALVLTRCLHGQTGGILMTGCEQP